MTRVLAVLALALQALPVQAAPEKRARIAVLEVTIEGDAAPELRAQIGKSLDGGLYTAGYDVVDRDEVAGKLRNARALVGCISTTCLTKIGALVNAKKFVRARIEASGAAYTIGLELLAPDAPGGLADRVERSCPVCTLREASELVSQAAVALVSARPLAPARAHVAIESRPPGASVTVDGVVVGVTPLEADLEAGPHEIRASLAGYRPGSVNRTLEPGERGEVLITLAPEAPPPPPPPARLVDQSRYGVWKWAAAGGAVAFLAGGVALVAMDGSGTDCAPSTTCMNRYATKGLGIGALVTGAALGGVATYLFMNDRVETSVAVVPGGARLSARIRF